MNKYYLFCIKKEFYLNYKNKSYVLYKILESLYTLETYDFSYGINVYTQLCNNFSVKLLHNYITNRMKNKRINKKTFKIDSIYHNTYVEIKYPCVVVYSNLKIPPIFKIFNIYNRNIFVCNFEEKDYMWLADISKKIGKYNK